MKVLAIDTAANFCSASLFDANTGRVLGRCVRDIGKGHVEHLMEVIEEAAAPLGLAVVDRIAVSTGPGSFTGIRAGVAAARGLALALQVPAIGISVLDALAAEARQLHDGLSVLVAVSAGRGEVYWGMHDAAGGRIGGPGVTGIADAATMPGVQDMALAGNAARQIAATNGAETRRPIGPEAATADILTFACLGALAKQGEKPRPLYLRKPDAKPQAGFAVERRVQ